MKIQMQVSIYPLRTQSLSEPIGEFCRILQDKELQVETLTMGSLVTGESGVIFEAVREGFEKLAKKYDVVMDFKVSNACPEKMQED